MITRIEALNYRCLRYISRPLDRFHVLVGPNGSGKTTFLDVVAFLSAFVSKGLDAAIEERTRNFQDLVWMREGCGFELAIEARVPQEKLAKLSNGEFDTVRYEVSLEKSSDSEQVVISNERGFLSKPRVEDPVQRTLFPQKPDAPQSIIGSTGGTRRLFTKATGGNDNYYSEVTEKAGKGWMPAYKFGPKKSTLGNLPEDETKFPVATWLKNLLTEGIQSLTLNSQVIKKASPPGQGRGFKSDGSNLPWVIENLIKEAQGNHQDWISHLRTALSDLVDIRTIERDDDKHRYLMICYDKGLKVPSWMASDGTLRLLALTLPAYLPALTGAFLIEEPENGIHPRAVETMIQSLSSVYDAQVLLATHSPVILNMVEPSEVLCFAKTPDGGTDIVSGDKHPALREWKQDVALGTLFAAGVLS